MANDDRPAHLPWDGLERRLSEQQRAIANREIDDFCKDVLNYNREHPKPGQRTPGDILEEVEERMAVNKRRLAMLQKRIGTALMFIIGIFVTTIFTGLLLPLIPWIRAHL